MRKTISEVVEHVPGITSPFWYIGNKGTFFVAHRENANLESIHALY